MVQGDIEIQLQFPGKLRVIFVGNLITTLAGEVGSFDIDIQRAWLQIGDAPPASNRRLLGILYLNWNTPGGELNPGGGGESKL